jgi:hypothetical protein
MDEFKLKLRIITKKYKNKGGKEKRYFTYAVAIPSKIAKIFELEKKPKLKLIHDSPTRNFFSIFREPFKKKRIEEIRENERRREKKMYSSEDIDIDRRIIPSLKNDIKNLRGTIKVHQREKKRDSDDKHIREVLIKGYREDIKKKEKEIKRFRQRGRIIKKKRNKKKISFNLTASS